ncbi:AAA family ATPase [Archaeoglobus profundus]|uniref:ATPase n=1 Tax=Archaeoglobus profundus (strain DSM 5631 / JCM 9629 / NBRC 100127 / Av18) TaxID=572546 RepID=D2RDP2_ARCPA|nr:ATP-binding protein [Archaeoglobus profundus]ADB58236.1 ATPase [Archaeoglobus profundus DSM 5631]
MKNPFVYGKIVGKDCFANRRKELELVKNAVLSGQNIIVYSPRRYGKSSLVYNAIQELDVVSVWIDCYGLISKRELAEKIATEVVKKWKTKRIVESIREIFKRVRPKIRLGEEIEVEFSFEEEDKAFEESLELPQKLAKRSKKRVAVVFDEFQEVVQLGNDVLPKMRSTFQKHADVCYIFVGSKRSMMEKIFRSALSPFYNFGMHVVLNKIPREEFKEFIKEKFEKSGIKIDSEAVDRILDVTDCHPYYTQMLCHKLWFDAFVSDKKVDVNDVVRIVEEIINEEADAYVTIWDDLTLSQRKVLVALSKGETDLYSAEFLQKYGFKRASNVQVAIKGLLKKEIISKVGNKYEISDPFFKLWILRMS